MGQESKKKQPVIWACTCMESKPFWSKPSSVGVYYIRSPVGKKKASLATGFWGLMRRPQNRQPFALTNSWLIQMPPKEGR